MAEGRTKREWDHTAAILCLIANVNRPGNKRAFKPSDFHPFESKRGGTRIPITKSNVHLLKDIFCTGKPS